MAVGLSGSSGSLLRWRLRFVSFFLLSITSLMVGRLIYLQVIEGPKLTDKARQQQQKETPPALARYPISDRRGTVLALDRPVFDLFAHPVQFSEPLEEVAAQLAPLLDVPVSGLEAQLQVAPTGIPLAHDVTETVAAQIRSLYLDGLEFNQSWQRIYPQQELMAGIIGYVDREHQGQAGLEFSQNEFFQAPPEQPVLSSDAMGLWLPELAPEDPQLLTQGYGIRLTLDSRLQRTARQSLRQQLQKFNAKRGTVIVLNSQTGAILSLVSEPSYNPTHYYRADPALFRNWAVSDLYEPGSTFKPINTAIALELKGITPTTVLPDEGRISVGGWPIQNNDFSQVGGRGALSISQILAYSSNVAMVHMMNRIPSRHYYRYLDRLGLNKRVGSDLPFETAAQLKPARQFIDYPIEPATTSFGQGFSLTPLHLAQLLGAIANGGELVVPYTVEGLYNHQGRLKHPLNRPQPRRVFSASTSQYVINMMGDVVKSGTGQGAQIPGYRLGGKTGTAQKAIGGTYSRERITSFAAIFPLESPRYVVLTVVDEPKGDDAYGSTVAIPVVKSVIESLITIEGIPPSHPEELRRSPSAPSPATASPTPQTSTP